MLPRTAWAAYRNGHLLYESMRGTKAEVKHYINAMFGINKICTMESLGIEICKVNIERW